MHFLLISAVKFPGTSHHSVVQQQQSDSAVISAASSGLECPPTQLQEQPQAVIPQGSLFRFVLISAKANVSCQSLEPLTSFFMSLFVHKLWSLEIRLTNQTLAKLASRIFELCVTPLCSLPVMMS